MAVAKNDQNKWYRGLHIILINPINFHVIQSKVFDTYKSSFELEEFITSPELKNGCVVIAACKDDCVWQLSNKCKMWFAEMGSQYIWKIKYRYAFAFIGTIGTKSGVQE